MKKNMYYVLPKEMTLCEESYIGYGIATIEGNEIRELVSDISTNRLTVKYLVDLCNDLDLDPLQINEVAEDFLP